MAWCDPTNDETKAFLSTLMWGDLYGELVMDVGCGMGNMSTRCILEHFPRLRKVVAIDKDSDCIRQSKREFKRDPFTKAEFICASITNWSELDNWEGIVSKIVSVHCISFVKRQKLAFENMFDLLRPGGEAALLFVYRSESDDVYIEMAKKPKWSKYFQDLNIERVIKLREFNPDYYKSMLTKIGFLVQICTEQITEHPFHNDDEYKDGILESAYVENIPRDLVDEFVEETFSTFLTLHPRNEAGKLNFKFFTIHLLVEKEDKVKELS